MTGINQGFAIRFGLEYGSDFTGGTPDQWRTLASGFTGSGGFQSAYTNALGSTLNATLNITGIQLEVGSQASPFEHRSFGDELARCQRYYHAYSNAGQTDALYFQSPYGTGTPPNTTLSTQYELPTTMRAQPSVTATLNGGSLNRASGSNDGNVVTFQMSSSSSNAAYTVNTFAADAEL